MERWLRTDLVRHLVVALIIGVGAIASADQRRPENVFLLVNGYCGAAHFVASLKPGIMQTINAPDFASKRTALILNKNAHDCGKDAVQYAVPLDFNNGSRIGKAVDNMTAFGDQNLVAMAEKALDIMVAERVCGRVIYFSNNYDNCSGSEGINRVLRMMDAHCEAMRVQTVAPGQRKEKVDGGSGFTFNIVTDTEDQSIHSFFREVSEGVRSRVHIAKTPAEIADKFRQLLHDGDVDGPSSFTTLGRGAKKNGKTPAKQQQEEKAKEKAKATQGGSNTRT
jgi:hypothetical protein